ncbi:MAG: hypothetical protein Q9M45_05180 [Robiginitomaculum sp.]|nr:hypothetical protein [Robiginitomaculum sp.]
MPETGITTRSNIDVTLPQGAPYSRTMEVLAQIQVAEKKLEEEIREGGKTLVENWYTRARENNVLALVKLVPETRALSAKETADRLRELISAVPDAEKITVEYLQNNNGPPLQFCLNSHRHGGLDQGSRRSDGPPAQL